LAVVDPMNPAPPVIRTFMPSTLVVRRTVLSTAHRTTARLPHPDTVRVADPPGRRTTQPTPAPARRARHPPRSRAAAVVQPFGPLAYLWAGRRQHWPAGRPRRV